MANSVSNNVGELKIEELDAMVLSDRELDGVAGGLQITKHIDKASPKLYELVSTGKHLAN